MTAAVIGDELAVALRAYGCRCTGRASHVALAVADASSGARPSCTRERAAAQDQPKPKPKPSGKAKALPEAPPGPPRAAATPGLPPVGQPLLDIGANLLDPMFQGDYRDKHRHPADLPLVMCRARAAGVVAAIVTAGSLSESREAVELCQRRFAAGEQWPDLFCTVGVHPTRCDEFGEGPSALETHAEALLAIGREGAAAASASGSPLCVAIGECGLDYDRLEFCTRETQLRCFELHLTALAAPLGLPLFLHCRTGDAARDMLGLLEKHQALLTTPPGVVHSFDGALEDAQQFIALGFYIGINGCSLKTDENLEVVRQLPGDRILLETDAPWCAIKPSHAGRGFVQSVWEEVKKPEKWEEGKCVKDRSEPCHLRQVLEVVAGCRGEDLEVLAAQVYDNTTKVFFQAKTE